MTAPRTPDAVLRRLDLKITRRLEGLLQGDHRTAFRGQGLDFADLREYQYHDDVRHMDLNFTARLQIPHVREFLEDREITAWFLLDMSPSIDFQSVSVSKRAVREQFDYLIYAKEGNRYVGTCSLFRMDWAVPKGEIGYWLRESAHGNGYMTEAVKRITVFGFETFNLQRIEIHCDAKNQPSCKVAERAGYLLEAKLRNVCREHREQKLRDTCIFAIIPPRQ